MLPDLIDKPLGIVILKESLNNGRVYAHTLLFLLVISIASFILYRRSGRIWLRTLALGTLFHLLLDSMWASPKVLFWPLFGFSFPTSETTEWFTAYWNMLFTEPSVYIPEITGLIIIILFAIRLTRHHYFIKFLRNGYLS